MDLDDTVIAEFAKAAVASHIGVIGTVVRATGCGPVETARALRAVNAAAGADRLAADIAAVIGVSPPPERFRVWQARALLDDLETWSQSALLDALGACRPGEAAEAVTAWAAGQAALLASVAELTSSPRHAGSDVLALVSLVLRRLRQATGRS
jgi:NAD-specific glutamate dehydrogenase